MMPDFMVVDWAVPWRPLKPAGSIRGVPAKIVSLRLGSELPKSEKTLEKTEIVLFSLDDSD